MSLKLPEEVLPESIYSILFALEVRVICAPLFTKEIPICEVTVTELSVKFTNTCSVKEWFEGKSSGFSPLWEPPI
jgi:hypothetical protein